MLSSQSLALGCAAQSLRQPRSRAAASGAARRPGCAHAVVFAAALPPTVADTKRKFVEAYKFPVPALYTNVIQELLVTQHLSRYNANYAYSAVSALGFCTVFDQLMEGFPQAETKEVIFKAFLKALDENPDQYRKDQAALTASASAAGGVEGLVGLECLSALKAKATAGTLVYSRFIAIGMFRLLELAGAMEPAALGKLAEVSGVPLSKINGDLALYKSLLSKLAAAKELMADYLEREKRKAAEREKEKAASSTA